MPSPFAQKIYHIVKAIPKGKVLTYQQVAQKAGRPGAYRAVGTILSKNIDPMVPCHRVIKSDGSIGGYNGLRGEKMALLKQEGAVQ